MLKAMLALPVLLGAVMFAPAFAQNADQASGPPEFVVVFNDTHTGSNCYFDFVTVGHTTDAFKELSDGMQFAAVTPDFVFRGILPMDEAKKIASNVCKGPFPSTETESESK